MIDVLLSPTFFFFFWWGNWGAERLYDLLKWWRGKWKPCSLTPGSRPHTSFSWARETWRGSVLDRHGKGWRVLGWENVRGGFKTGINKEDPENSCDFASMFLSCSSILVCLLKPLFPLMPAVGIWLGLSHSEILASLRPHGWFWDEQVTHTKPIRTDKFSFWKFYWNSLWRDALFSLGLKLGRWKPEAAGRHLSTIKVRS